MDERVRENYFAGGMSMYRGIGLSLLVMGAGALLQGATLFAGITNGTFDDPVNGWDYGWTINGEVNEGGAGYGHPQSALIPGSEGLTNVLFQQFSIGTNESALRFDLTFEFDSLSETDYFKAYLFEWNSPVLPLDPVGTPFYWISTSGLGSHEYNASNVNVLNLGDFLSSDPSIPNRYIRTITAPITSGWTQAVIWFELVGEEELYPNPAVAGNAFVSNVEVTAVPEPATMTLGLIGVAMVGAARRKSQSTQS
jgi:hypothetical protein